jgi:type VI secretion system protein ImpH
MATTQWGNESFVITELIEKPYNFDFFQAVRLLHYYFDERIPVGWQTNNGVDVTPLNEVVSFKVPVSLAFQPSDIVSLTLRHKESAVGSSTNLDSKKLDTLIEIVVSFMGVTGPQGILPNVYTEYLYERCYEQDYALRDFLDIFNHRLISLYYRAWQKYRVSSNILFTDSKFTECLFSIIGCGFDSIKNSSTLDLSVLLEYAGILARKPLCAETIENVISLYFCIKVQLKQFVGQWLTLDNTSQSRLGCSNVTLGIDCVIGNKFYDVHSKIVFILGPLRYSQYVTFLPNGSNFMVMIQLINSLVGCELDYEIQMQLASNDIPHTKLGQSLQNEPMLGWNTWLKTRPCNDDDLQYFYCYHL